MDWYEWKISLLIIAASLIIWAYLRVKSAYSFFEKRGIPYVKPTFLLGSDVRGALGQDNLGISIDRLYKELKEEKYGGVYLGLSPSLLVKDPSYVNWILTSKFEYFPDRTFIVDEKTNPLDAHLFNLKGNKWKYLRSKLSPAFTAGKLKSMYGEMDHCSQGLFEYFDKVADGRDVDLFEPLASLTTDVIGSTAFGIDAEGLKNPDSKFRAMGKKLFDLNLKNTIILFLRLAAPNLLIALKIRTIDEGVSDYFRSTIKKVFDYRRKNSVVRNDFVQLALQLHEKGFIEVDSGEMDSENSIKYDEKTSEKFEITEDLLAAQSFVFFIGGFETTARTLHHLTYMLSLHREIQETVREEVRAAKKKHGDFTHDAVKDLPFLEKCIQETLRLYPPFAALSRECIRDCVLPDGRKLEKGMQVLIPLFSLHRDPEYFPEPERFNPDRFDVPPAKGTYAPFGDGPRICIGKRFALMEIKMTVAKILDKYIIEKSPLNKYPIDIAPTMTLSLKPPVYVRLSKISSAN